MALQTSGPISLDDIHVEAGGTTATQVTINDTDVLNLIGKSSATQMGFNEWYGASAGPTLKYTMSATHISPTTSGKNATAAYVSFKSSTAITASQDFITDPLAEGFIIRDFFVVKNNTATNYREGVTVLSQGFNGVLGTLGVTGSNTFRKPNVADNYFIAKYNGVAVIGPTDELYNGIRTTNPNVGYYLANDTSLIASGLSSPTFNLVNNRQTLSAWSLEYYSI